MNKEEKKKYKELFEKVKNKEISLDSLDCADAFVIGCMFDEENEILKKEIEEMETINNENAKKINKYKKKKLIV